MKANPAPLAPAPCPLLSPCPDPPWAPPILFTKDLDQTMRPGLPGQTTPNYNM